MDNNIHNTVAKRRPRTAISPSKPAITKIAESMKKQIFKNHFDRKMLLKIPDEILNSNSDKHFVWVNMPRLEKGGFYHPDGYKLFTAQTDNTDEDNKHLVNHFAKSPDGYIHRNEMVLAYIPQEEYEQRKFEEEVVRGNVNLEDVITNNPSIGANFSPHAKREEEVKEFENKKEEVTNG